MPIRYPIALAVTSLFLLAAPAWAQPSATQDRHRGRLATPAPARARSAAPEQLYSRRALRRARIIVQMRLFELREERLERVERAIERRLPAADILRSALPPLRAAKCHRKGTRCAHFP